MITIEKAYEIAKNEEKGGKLIDAFETDDYYAFFFAPDDWDGKVGIGGEPTFVRKQDGKMDYTVVTLDCIKKGIKKIDSNRFK